MKSGHAPLHRLFRMDYLFYLAQPGGATMPQFVKPVFFQRLFFAAVLLISGSAGLAQAQVNFYDQTLRIASFGGDYTRSQMLAHVRPWEAMTGKAVDMVDYVGGVDDIRNQVTSANVKWDVVDMEYSDLIAACDEGLLESADTGILKNGMDGASATDDIPQDYFHECGYPSVVWSTVLAYDSEVYAEEKPATVADFFDVTRFPGKRGMRRDPRGLLEWSLMSAGVAPGDVYSVLSTPQGVNFALEIAEKIKPHIQWWTTGTESIQLLSEGHVTMTSAWNGRLYRPIVEQNFPIDIVWDGQLWEVEYWAVPKGSPSMDNALDFISFATQSENMAELTKYIPYGPVRKSAESLIDEQVKPYLPTSNMSNSLRVDSAWWAQNMPHIRVTFEEWLKPKATDLERNVRF